MRPRSLQKEADETMKEIIEAEETTKEIIEAKETMKEIIEAEENKKEIIEAKENMNETIEIEARETVKRAEGSKSNDVTYWGLNPGFMFTGQI